MLSEQKGGVFGGGMGNESLLEFLSGGVLAPLGPEQLGVSLREINEGQYTMEKETLPCISM